MNRFLYAGAVALALLLAAGCKGDSKEFGILIQSLQDDDPARRWQAILRAERLEEPDPAVIEQLKTIFRMDPEAVIRAQALRALQKHDAVDEPILHVVAQNAMTRQDYLGQACFDLLKARGPDLLKEMEKYAASREDEAERESVRALIHRLRSEMDD